MMEDSVVVQKGKIWLNYVLIYDCIHNNDISPLLGLLLFER
jgi:hypothetical protein